jgi:hercynine metabolism protein
MANWFDDLEARLNQQLEAFLQANPAQQARLEQQEAQELQQRLGQQRLRLQQQAQQQRQDLLTLASDIRQWQGRVSKARQAGATALAARAEAHLGSLMLQGRQRWQQLAELGAEFAALEARLEQLRSQSQQAAGSGLEADWAAFEAEQELHELRRRQTRG